MKKCLPLLSIAMLLCLASYGQDYKKFKVGIGLGYALSSGEGSQGGVLITIEPAYRLSDNLSLGLRLESAALTRGYSGTLAPGTTLSVAAIGSATMNGQYYFSSNKFRPFVGAGFGMYQLADVTATSSGSTVGTVLGESVMGFYPRIGFDMGHFNMALDYNILPGSKPAGSTSSDVINNSYIGIRIGAFIGGGTK